MPLGRSVVVAAVLAWGAVMGGADDDLATIHIVAHSHCDPGWLETYETYFRDDVRAILSSVVAELHRSPERRFVWSEMCGRRRLAANSVAGAVLTRGPLLMDRSFFRLWYDELSEQDRAQFKRLLESGQFEFVNGGWVQNDEACPHYSDIISQTTQGHTYLYDRFGVVPRYGWQIDPFGHSSVTPALFRLFGYEAVVINRIDFRLKAALKQHRLMEFLWRGTDLGQHSDLFTHVLHTHYSSPQGYDWEGGSEQIHDFNIDRLAAEFVSAMLDRMAAYKTRELLVPFGDDFKFKNAAIQFSNMDRLIDHINRRTGQHRVRIRYSTLSEYFGAVSRANASFATLVGDFFPYADNADSFWTGFYTTRPQLKRIARTVSAQLRAADLLVVQARAELPANRTEPLYGRMVEARRDAALFLHHDAITGTARDHVVLDYTERMASAYDTATDIVRSLAASLIAVPAPAGSEDDGRWELDPDSTTLRSGSHVVTVLNTVSWARADLICRSVSSRFVSVRDYHGNVITAAQVSAAWAADSATDPGALPSHYRICFRTEIPALSISVFTLHVYDRDPGTEHDTMADLATVQVVSRADVIGRDCDSVRFAPLLDDAYTRSLLRLRNGIVEVQLSPVTGLVESVLDRVSGRTVQVEHELAQYRTFGSGAYIFRPDPGPEPIPEIAHAEPVIRVVHGPVLSAATVQLGQYAVEVELLRDTAHIQVRLQVLAGDNREIVTRWSTSLNGTDEFYSSNGAEFLRRRRRALDPISANYYPSVSGAVVRDDGMQFTVLTGHTSGVASPRPVWRS